MGPVGVHVVWLVVLQSEFIIYGHRSGWQPSWEEAILICATRPVQYINTMYIDCSVPWLGGYATYAGPFIELHKLTVCVTGIDRHSRNEERFLLSPLTSD